MRIEDAIKQTRPFGSEQQRAAVNLLFTYSWLGEKMREFFSQYGITRKQYNILRILKGAGKPVSTSFIRERLLDKMSDVSRIVDRLTDKGWVVKSACASDKRLIDVSMTQEGLGLLEKIEAQQQKLDNFMSTLDQSELKQLNHLLDKLRGA